MIEKKLGKRVAKAVKKNFSDEEAFLMALAEVNSVNVLVNGKSDEDGKSDEAELDEGLVALRKNEPMPYPEILELIGQIQSYLNRMCHAMIESLTFDTEK